VIRRAPRPEVGFTLFDNETLRDTRISFLALGVLCSVLSRPDNWTTGIKALAKERREGRAAISAALADLEEIGYLRRERVQGDGGLWSTEVVFYDRPQVGPSPEDPSPGEPKPGNTGPGENLEFPQVAPSPAKPGLGEPGLGEPGLGSPAFGITGPKKKDLPTTNEEEEINPGAHAREVALIERDDLSPGFLTTSSGDVLSSHTPSVTAEFSRQVKATTEEIMAGWQTWIGRTLPSIVVVEVGKIVKRCVADGVDAAAIKLGLCEWTEAGMIAPKYRLEPAIAGAVTRRLKRDADPKPNKAAERFQGAMRNAVAVTGKTAADLDAELEASMRGLVAQSRSLGFGSNLAIGGAA
jgi:hypothetical protein